MVKQCILSPSRGQSSSSTANWCSEYLLQQVASSWLHSQGRIGETDGEYLNVVIQPWLAEGLRIEAGSGVIVDNKNGKFTITRSAANDEPDS